MRNKKTHPTTCATPKKIWRALVTVLSISVIGTGNLAVNCFNSYAYTVDDLREFVGLERIATPEGKTRLSNIIYLYGEQQHNKKIMESINQNDLDLNIIENMKKTKEELNGINDNINNKFNRASALEVIALYRQAETVVNKLNKYNPTEISYDTTYETITEEQYVKAIEQMTKTNDVTELGDIGKSLKSLVESQTIEIVQPFGDIIDEDNIENMLHSNGLYIKNKNLGGDVKNLWNGTVTKIVDSKEWGKYVVIRSGDSLEHSISFLSEVYVSEGDTVDQYQPIGKSDYDYIYIEIILDGEYIDPLLVFGQKGIKAYYKWLGANSGVVKEHADYSNVKDNIVTPQFESNNIDIDPNYTGIRVQLVE